MVTGAVLLAAVTIDALTRRKRQQARSPGRARRPRPIPRCARAASRISSPATASPGSTGAGPPSPRSARSSPRRRPARRRARSATASLRAPSESQAPVLLGLDPPRPVARAGARTKRLLLAVERLGDEGAGVAEHPPPRARLRRQQRSPEVADRPEAWRARRRRRRRRRRRAAPRSPRRPGRPARRGRATGRRGGCRCRAAGRRRSGGVSSRQARPLQLGAPALESRLVAAGSRRARPLRSAARRSSWSVSQRRLRKTVRRRPARSACSTSSRASSALGASGLSTTTGSPASSARRAQRGVEASFGVATTAKSCSDARSKSSSASGTISRPGVRAPGRRACARVPGDDARDAKPRGRVDQRRMEDPAREAVAEDRGA